MPAPDTDPEREPDASRDTDPERKTGSSPDTDPEREVAGERHVETVTRPDHETARDMAAEALAREDLLTVVGRCTVDYDGRASSTLGPGDRHVTCKPDGTAMVHTDEGRQPVNWQPPGSEHEATLDDGCLRLRSTREDPDAELVVDFRDVLQVSALGVVDEADRSLAGSHEDLKERVLAEPALVEPGFAPLATERDTPAGAVDVYGEDGDGRPTVLELKRSRAGPDAVSQLSRYVEALERELHDDATVRGVLVAPSATDRTRELLAERGLGFESVEPDPP